MNNDYLYEYRGSEIARIMKIKIDFLRKDIAEMEALALADKSQKMNANFGEFGASGYNDIIGGKYEGKIMSLNSMLDICRVMLIEMEKRPKDKYKLSMDDLIWLRKTEHTIID